MNFEEKIRSSVEREESELKEKNREKYLQMAEYYSVRPKRSASRRAFKILSPCLAAALAVLVTIPAVHFASLPVSKSDPVQDIYVQDFTLADLNDIIEGYSLNAASYTVNDCRTICNENSENEERLAYLLGMADYTLKDEEIVPYHVARFILSDNQSYDVSKRHAGFLQNEDEVKQLELEGYPSMSYRVSESNTCDRYEMYFTMNGMQLYLEYTSYKQEEDVTAFSDFVQTVIVMDE